MNAAAGEFVEQRQEALDAGVTGGIHEGIKDAALFGNGEATDIFCEA
jgi:hypothetical protein